MSAPPLTRELLERYFRPEELVTVPQTLLADVADPDVRHVLGTLGVPVCDNPWLDVAEDLASRLERVADWDWELAGNYADVPPGADRWISLALIPYDTVVVDPDNGTVHCVPQDDEIYPLNSSLRAFVHFLCILQSERPHFDVGLDAGAAFEPAASQARAEAAMRAVDPAALEDPRSRWHDILEYIVDPEAHYA